MFFTRPSLLFILLSYSLMASGQLNTQLIPATIKFKNGNEIKGFAADQELKKMNFRVRFKSALNDKDFIVYDTSTVQTLKFENGEAYELITFKPHHANRTIAEIAMLMVRGLASLYLASYENVQIYVITKSDKSYPLQEDRIIGYDTRQTNYYFLNYLDSAFSDSFVIRSKIPHTKFGGNSFVKLVEEYNRSVNSPFEKVSTTVKRERFFLVGLHGMIKNKNGNGAFFQTNFRAYFPKLSRGTSLNVGINYFHYVYGPVVPNGFIKPTNIKGNLFTIPFQVQQNFLNGRIRPYIFAGFNLSYVNEVTTDNNPTSVLDSGLQQNFGVGILYGGGIEATIYKGFLLKSEYRYENRQFPIMVGFLKQFNAH